MYTGGNVIEVHSKEEWDKQQADASNAGKVVRFTYQQTLQIDSITLKSVFTSLQDLITSF
jgi:hypothetical protein